MRKKNANNSHEFCITKYPRQNDICNNYNQYEHIVKPITDNNSYKRIANEYNYRLAINETILV